MRQVHYEKIIFLICLIVVGIFSVSNVSEAINLNVNYPKIPTPIGEVDLNCLEIGSCQLNISILIIVIFSTGVWLAGIIAFLALLYSGLTYILAGANPNQKYKATKIFSNALWGLLILLFANILIGIINPELNKFQDPDFLGVSPGQDNFRGLTFKGGDPLVEDAPQITNGGENKTCQELCMQSGKGEADCNTICSASPCCGTPYNPGCLTKAQIQDTVWNDLFGQLNSGGLNFSLSNKYREIFFFEIIPGESAWKPCAIGGGVNCLPVNLYQLETGKHPCDPARSGKACKGQCSIVGCCGEDHWEHPVIAQTEHAITRFFKIRNNGRGCSGFEYWSTGKSYHGC